MTETHDLVTRLLAAIGQRETAALAASPGPWAPNAEHDEIVAVDGITVADGFALSGNQLRATVNFIVDNDPPTVARHCAADRKILDLHAPVRVPPTWATFGLTRHLESTGGLFCKTCCDEDDGTSYAQRVGLEWPCDTIRALAERYGLAEQQEDRP